MVSLVGETLALLKWEVQFAQVASCTLVAISYTFECRSYPLTGLARALLCSTPSGPPGFGVASAPEDRAVIDVWYSER